MKNENDDKVQIKGQVKEANDRFGFFFKNVEINYMNRFNTEKYTRNRHVELTKLHFGSF